MNLLDSNAAPNDPKIRQKLFHKLDWASFWQPAIPSPSNYYDVDAVETGANSCVFQILSYAAVALIPEIRQGTGSFSAADNRNDELGLKEFPVSLVALVVI